MNTKEQSAKARHTAEASAAHTPGPWYMNAADGVIAEVDGVVTLLLSNCSTENRRLIAAAPDLYAALQAILSDVVPMSGPCTQSLVRTDKLDAARAALAKAKS